MIRLDGSEIRRSPVEVGSLSVHAIIYRVFVHPNGGWEWDFWTINSTLTVFRNSRSFTPMEVKLVMNFMAARFGLKKWHPFESLIFVLWYLKKTDSLTNLKLRNKLTNNQQTHNKNPSKSKTSLVLSTKNHLLRPFTASALVPFRPQLPCLPASAPHGNDPKTWASWGSWPGSTTGSACQVRMGGTNDKKLKIKHFHWKKKCSNQEIYVKGGLSSILNDFSCILYTMYTIMCILYKQ